MKTAPLQRYLYGIFRRYICCTLGVHGSKCSFTGEPANYCEWGCRHVFNPNALQDWVVTLRTGEIYEVQGVNQHHAASMVVYGGQVGKIDPRGVALAEIKVHRANILSVVRKE